MRLPETLDDVAERSTSMLVEVSPVTLRRQVDFGECDPAGIVYTPRFADYLLAAFHTFMRILFNDMGRDSMPEATPMRGLELDFRKMLFPGDWYCMGVYITGVRTRSFDLAVVARDDEGRLTFVGRLSPIAADRRTNEAVTLPADFKARLRLYQERCPAPPEAIIPLQVR